MSDNTSQQPTSSYISKPRRFSGKSLFVQIALLLAVIIVFIFGLAYFNLLSISKITNPFSTKNTITKSVKPTKPIRPTPTPTLKPFVIDTTKKGDISAVSDIPTYKVTLLQKQALVDLLASWGTFSVVEHLYKTQGKVPTSNIIIHLTDKEQKGNIVTNPKIGTYLASGIVINPPSFDLYIYVLPSILATPSQNPASLFQWEFVSTVWRFSHSTGTAADVKKVEDNLTKVNSTLLQNKTQFFAIEKI